VGFIAQKACSLRGLHPERRSFFWRYELDEEIEDEEEEAEEDKEGRPGETAAGELGDGMKEAGGNDAEARFAAALIEWAGRNVAGEIATEGGELVVNPEGELRAMAPKKEGAEHKDGVANKREQTERWTGTPRKHETSPRLGGKNQASS
jgi:hypothetical protein